MKKTSKKVKQKNANLIIIDASGSMASKASEVIGGLKTLFSQITEDAKKDKRTVSTTTLIVDFSGNGDYRELLSSEDSLSIDEKIASSYRTRGMTALYDAIGKAFSSLDQKGKYDSVFVNILTDGDENDSKEFSSPRIQSLLKEKKDQNWAITFMGTTEASINNAVSLGISRGNTMSFADSAAGVKGSMTKLSSVRTAYYSMSKEFLSAAPKEKERLSKKMDKLMEDDNK